MPILPLIRGQVAVGTILRSDIPDVPLPCNSSQLLLGDPEASPEPDMMYNPYGKLWVCQRTPPNGGVQEAT